MDIMTIIAAITTTLSLKLAWGQYKSHVRFSKLRESAFHVTLAYAQTLKVLSQHDEKYTTVYNAVTSEIEKGANRR